MKVYTESPNGELVEWWLGEAWSKAVRDGLDSLPSPHGGQEKIVLIETDQGT